MQFFFIFLPVTRVQGTRVSKRHYMSLKRHYRLLKNTTIRLNSILSKSSFKIGAFSLLVWKFWQNAGLFF